MQKKISPNLIRSNLGFCLKVDSEGLLVILLSLEISRMIYLYDYYLTIFSINLKLKRKMSQFNTFKNLNET